MQGNQPEKPILSNRRTWIIVILLFLGICCLFVIGWSVCFGSAAFIALRQNANTTATAEKNIQVGTATASARETEFASIGVSDPFDSNKSGWKVGKEDNEFWAGEINIENGVYAWTVRDFKKVFLNYSDFSNSPRAGDFDTSVDIKIIEGSDLTCSGIIFRKAPGGWEYGGYAISICKSGQFFVGYVDAHAQWVTSSGWITSSAIQKDDWNHVEVSARGAHIICKINDFVVYEMDDSHQLNGNVALFIEIHADANSPKTNLPSKWQPVFLPAQLDEKISVTFLFDNFSFQGR